jgi:hypothetical protein
MKRRQQMQKSKKVNLRPLLNQRIADDAKTWWNGRPCKARIVRVVVAKAEKPSMWYAPFAGQEREAVEISDADQSGHQPFYLDNEAYDDEIAGLGWAKVTIGRGGPDWGHRNLTIERVVEEVEGTRIGWTEFDAWAAGIDFKARRERQLAEILERMNANPT